LKKGSQCAEVTVNFRGGSFIHASANSDDMYASIDLLSHKLARSIKKHNEKVKNKHQKERHHAKESFALDVDREAFDEDELLAELKEEYKKLSNVRMFYSFS
jgi:hypothetical protein